MSMRPGLSVAQTISAGLAVASIIPFAHALSPRTKISDSYDFVVVGGGLAGLVLGGRLSEDTNHTVLVLESGSSGDDFRERIDTPAYSYFESLWTTPLNWGFHTVAQPNVDGRQIYWPRGKVLGGSSAINGLYLTRPGEIEVNSWKDMLGDMNSAENWSWDSFHAAMKKSETFTPPTEAVAEEAAITWDSSSHGTHGPIHASYPGYTFAQISQWSKSLEKIGIPRSQDMYGGKSWGSEVSTTTVNPKNWTRSYSRTGYLDPLADHGNYDVLANAHVTRILFDKSSPSDNKTANAVEYTPDGGKTKSTVKVKKEVILAAGSIGSPAVLLHSGVGPKDVLSSAGVKLVSELPGVGQHLQDHLSATVKWNTNQESDGSIFSNNATAKNDKLFLSYVDSAVAYVNATAIYGDDVEKHQKTILDNIDQSKPNTTSDAGVVAGYKAIYNTTASKIFSSPIGQIEILFMNSDPNGDIGITASLQHPYSHGRIYINSSNPMDYPVIDPNYLSHPADSQILRDGLKMVRSLGQTDPLKSTLTSETDPGSSVDSDAKWVDWLRKSAKTDFHPSSSCAMLPRNEGGVVDANLRVYGLGNVRVADASVPPIALSTHLMASTYGVAEKASSIIREFHNDPWTDSESGNGSGSPTSSGSGSSLTGTAHVGDSSSTKNNSNHQNGGVRTVSSSLNNAWWIAVITVVVNAFAFDALLPCI